MKTFLGILFYALFAIALTGCEEENTSGALQTFSGNEQSSGSGFGQGGTGQGESGSIGGGEEGEGGDGGQLGGMVSDLFIQENYTEAYDFLWVVDNSGSMSNIRAFMSQNLVNFASVLESRQSLDWQMAVTITDDRAWAGNLVSYNGTRVVHKQMANVASTWAGIIGSIVGTSHSGWEQGLESGFDAIENFGAEFIRGDVPLVIAYVTDEEDFSCQSNCNNFSGAPENMTTWTAFPTSRYVDQFSALKQDQNVDVIVYPIVHRVPLGVECNDDYGSPGTRYMTVQAATQSGASLSICESELAASFDRVAQLTANLSACFNLTRPMLDENTLSVRVEGVLVQESETNGYVYEEGENAICFNGVFIPSNGDSIEVRYQSIEN